ncbi:DcaP family trimeric outer membrane transporter [Methylococcus mesophilus]|uniref:DcaP family trimeric outer membrane transporter n=1 Tax=Methylococcus mesophilus TaxID=2993564 RepID=UPI00224AB43A|nr:DcaP family trimeric outer membrane transporter [Methylococcus mesophilus]UZR29551.1 DcaP family trimeric outer membrane transporter [Methylococcus mesophilus]
MSAAALAGAMLASSGAAYPAEFVADLKAQLEAMQRSNREMEARMKAMEQLVATLAAQVQPAASPKPTPEMSPRQAAWARSVAAAPDTQRAEKQAHPGDVFRTEPEPGRLGEITYTKQTTVDLYGFIEADSIYDAGRENPVWQATTRASMIPVNCPPQGNDPGCGTSGQTTFSARQSRFGMNTLFPTALGDIKTKFEFDLFGVGANAGQTAFRLRHAWGELGQFGAGQTWSVFMDTDVWPNIIDYWGPGGMIFQRQPQLRWTPDLGAGWSAAMSLESPNSAIDSGKAQTVDPDLAKTVASKTQWPDLVGQIRTDRDWGHAQAAGVLRSVGYQVTGRRNGNPSQNFVGWGFNFSGAFKTFGKDQLLGQVAYGQGIASYVEDGGVDLAPQAMLRGQVMPLLGVLGYYDHYWSERWSSSIGYSETLQDNSGGQNPDAFHIGRYASVNLLYAPMPKFLAGIEMMWARRENKNGDAANDPRVQFSVRYNYDVHFHPSF